MVEGWSIAVSPEVAEWYRGIRPADRAVVDKMFRRLELLGNQLHMPHSKSLGEGLFELRFSIQEGRVEQRITYIFDVPRKTILLTTFRKTRQNERREVARAREARKNYLKERGD